MSNLDQVRKKPNIDRIFETPVTMMHAPATHTLCYPTNSDDNPITGQLSQGIMCEKEQTHSKHTTFHLLPTHNLNHFLGCVTYF